MNPPHAVLLDWADFLSRQDPIWQRLPQSWQDAPFIGNGTQGLMLYQTGPRTLCLLLGSNEVQDHRPGSAFFERARLPVGRFEIETVGDLQNCDLRIDLWNAELRGTIYTSRGAIEICAVALTREQALWLHTKTAGDEADYTLNFVPGPAQSPRADPKYKRPAPENYLANPAPGFAREDEIELCVQPLTDAQTAVAWKETMQGQTRTLFCSIAHSRDTSARQKALDALKSCRETSPEALLEVHRAWWHDYYPASFVALPDAYWQSFYWIQLYKLAAATRADAPFIDNQGPWLAPTPWPYATWNLNVQLTYWPVVGSNHLDLGRSLSDALRRHRAALIANVPAEYRADSAALPRATTQDLVGEVQAPPAIDELGNLPWACHNLWLMYRATMDDEFLRDDLSPILRRAINYYLHFLVEGEDKKLHLPVTHSPEYGDAPDANYDLALLRWGCQVLLAASARLKIDDPLLPRWRQVLAGLTPFPQDENGLMVGRGVALEKPHRHFSHLLMIYPLQLLNASAPDERALIEKSLDWWMKTPQGQAYQFTGAAAMVALLGQGERALDYLNQLRARDSMGAATMYAELGPVIETPLSAAQCLLEMLLQSAGVWNGEAMPTPLIRVFPALPASWPDATFENLRAEGAFLISAVRREGQTCWIRLQSLAGERALLMPGMTKPTLQGEGLKLRENGCYEVSLQPGQSVELFAAGTTVAPALEAVTVVGANPFGLKIEP